jgi:4-amino-4-deoxy-L-arabinose transferase-like glycosyltransferase
VTFPKRLSQWALPLLGLAALTRFLIMAVLPLTDPTEGRYAQISQEMALTGDWVTPRVWMADRHLPFLGKPPLFFWTAAGTMRLMGGNAFAARLPSFLSAALLLVLLRIVLDRHLSRGAGTTAALMVITCGFFFGVAGSVATDMMFSACVAGSLLAYFAFLSETRPRTRGRWSLLVFFLLACGCLTKGPVALVLFGLPVLIWTARWRMWSTLRHHRWLPGILLFLAVTVPWHVLCELRNPGFLKYFFVNENLLRFVTSEYGDAYGSGHQYPYGTAVLMLLGATAPWSLVGLGMLFRRERLSALRCRTDPMASFLFLGFAVGTLFWCLARQLLMTYLLPMVPLFAAWAVWVTRDRPGCWLGIRRFSALLLAALTVGGMVCAITLDSFKTSRGIVMRAKRYADAVAYPGPLLFERNTPYSALFYGRGWVLPHPKEKLRESLARLNGQECALVAVRKRRAAMLAALPDGTADCLGTSGDWLLVNVTLPCRAAPQTRIQVPPATRPDGGGRLTRNLFVEEAHVRVSRPSGPRPDHSSSAKAMSIGREATKDWVRPFTMIRSRN